MTLLLLSQVVMQRRANRFCSECGKAQCKRKGGDRSPPAHENDEDDAYFSASVTTVV